ncbi:hypothetical protein [Aneurinibacillus migulanus]|uniref:hypothetical protein n=1 Tax=Aneurinibacillus migulanus TaxID=47500 RepID=UPI00130E5768|nr:hypothetical protein [Aneurinibacillus migulanus]MED0891293.1 hypothetical protein [Aneurinibacillus migulanus]MED1614018.1 hypothetical protein [Aneurinibacillus migulanus]MED4727996.1 hypothetical protein [Aneurinibacillus migulanus]
MHASACFLVFFSQRGSTAALRSRLAGEKAALYASVWETNRRPFVARWADRTG